MPIHIALKNIMTITTTDTGLLRLMQLSSAALPVGGFSYSQGLEFAVEEGWLKNRSDVADWLQLQLRESLAQTDVPVLLKQLQAFEKADREALRYWNLYILACRETRELRLTDTSMGAALVKLMRDLSMSVPPDYRETSFVSAFACAAQFWGLEVRAVCHGYLWSWLENQIAAATKLVPLGQTDAQRLIGQLLGEIPLAIDVALDIDPQDIGGSLPAIAMASSRHETQYSRLFRS